jgi:hypothetical protein
MLRYHLRTLMLVTGVAPPAIAFLWWHWGLVLFLAVAFGLLALWLGLILALARFFAGLVASVMD